MSADPDAYAAGLAKLVQAGDPRSITIMRELFASSGSVAIPRAEATVRAMSTEDRRALLLELEARGCTLPEQSEDGGMRPSGAHAVDQDATLPTLPDEAMPVDAVSDEASGRVAVGDTHEPDSMP